MELVPGASRTSGVTTAMLWGFFLMSQENQHTHSSPAKSLELDPFRTQPPAHEALTHPSPSLHPETPHWAPAEARGGTGPGNGRVPALGGDHRVEFWGSSWQGSHSASQGALAA